MPLKDWTYLDGQWTRTMARGLWLVRSSPNGNAPDKQFGQVTNASSWWYKLATDAEWTRGERNLMETFAWLENMDGPLDIPKETPYSTELRSCHTCAGTTHNHAPGCQSTRRYPTSKVRNE